MKQMLLTVTAILALAAGAAFADDFLEVDEAFKVTVESSLGHEVQVKFDIANEYSLYKERITISSPTAGVVLGRIDFPASQTHEDQFFGPQQVFTHEATLEVPLTCRAGSENVVIEVAYQGCADAGLCYPTEHRQFKLELPDGACTG